MNPTSVSSKLSFLHVMLLRLFKTNMSMTSRHIFMHGSRRKSCAKSCSLQVKTMCFLSAPEIKVTALKEPPFSQKLFDLNYHTCCLQVEVCRFGRYLRTSSAKI